jgi:hypothetical protein
MLLSVTILFFCLTTKHSVGNVVEIIDLLDADTHTRVELQENYNMLKEKWGEWILFGDEGTGISVKYINVGNALFSGLMITFGTITIISFFLAIIIGKFLLPMLSKMYTNNNEQMVDLATLQTQESIKELKSEKMEEWF